MSERHSCPLCGFSREAEHATVLDPACPNCGGVLEHAPAALAPRALPTLHPARARLLDRVVVALVVLPLLAAAVKVGWQTGGLALAAGALTVAALAAYVALAPPTRAR